MKSWSFYDKCVPKQELGNERTREPQRLLSKDLKFFVRSVAKYFVFIMR